MRMKFHGYDPAACKPGDKGEWEMLEDDAEPGGGSGTKNGPKVTPPAKGKRNPAMEYLKGGKK